MQLRQALGYIEEAVVVVGVYPTDNKETQISGCNGAS
jgi:hypothetical protein